MALLNACYDNTPLGRSLKGVILFAETFQRFVEDDFEAKAYATRIIQSHAISQHLAKLAEGINMLDKEIHSQVGGPISISL